MPADIFISYAREDQARIERLSRALEAEGFSVWWDRDIAGGAEFTKETEVKLNEAKAIVVAWSKASVASMWVADEATVGRAKGNLVPVVIDDVEPKLGFRQIQTIDLKGWRGDQTAPAFQALIRALKMRVAGEAAAPPACRAPPTLAARLRKHALPLGAAAMAAVAIGVLLISLFVDRAPFGTPPSAAPQGEEAAASLHPEEPSAQDAEVVTKGGVGLAVLPFTNLSSDPEQEHFADGLTEELLNWLGNVEGLDVPGRTSSFQFKDKPDDLRAIGVALNVDYLLEGSVRRSGDALRITAQLIEAETGFHLWSETYDRKLDDIFAIQDEIARIVVTELLGKIPQSGAANPAAVGDVNPRAHELYLEGRALWAQRQPDALDKFRAAVAIDPRHALAQAYFAVAAAHLFNIGWSTAEGGSDVELAHQALAAAVGLKPRSADVLFAQGWVAEFMAGENARGIPNAAAIEFYEGAVRAGPRHVEALHALARAEPSPEKRNALYERIVGIDPGYEPARINIVIAAMNARDRAKATLLMRQGLVVSPAARGVWAGIARGLGDLALAGEAAFGDDPAFDGAADLPWIAPALLADLGAVEEARFLSMKEAAAGQKWSAFARVAIAVLDADAKAELAAAEALHGDAGFLHYSTWMLANALIRKGDYARAYDVIVEHRPDIAEASLDKYSLYWDEFADMDFVTAAHALDLAGRREEARALWKLVDDGYRNLPAEATAAITWGHSLNLALVHSRLGDRAEAVKSFRAAYDSGFRYLASYNCSGCIHDGFSAEHGLFAELVKIPENAALVERIKVENGATLEQFNRQYKILDRVHEMMAAEAAE